MNPRRRRQRRQTRNARRIVCWRTHAIVYASSSKPWRGSYDGHEERARCVTRRQGQPKVTQWVSDNGAVFRAPSLERAPTLQKPEQET